MEKIKLILCDIDNTLVPKHQDLSERAVQAIHQLKKSEILFGLASGRSISQLHRLETSWNIRCDVIIGLNGSELYDGLDDFSEQLYFMEPAWIKACFEIMAPFDCNPTLRRDGISYVRNYDKNVAASSAYIKNDHQVHIVKDDAEFWQGPAFKVGFRVKAEDMPAIEKRAAKFPSQAFKGFKTENTMFEFCNAEASKGSMLKRFCSRHDIDLRQVCCFGDMTNDISMLQAAGIGVCMLNGSEDAKAAADCISEKTADEDGWADYVEKHILNH